MKTLTVMLAIFLGFGGAAAAQSSGGERGSTPPGTAQDGSRPGDGAITGGSIVPGESGGVPAAGAPGRRARHCNELSGTLREQCLLDEQGASTGGTTVPSTDPQKPVPPRTAPPPQNPR